MAGYRMKFAFYLSTSFPVYQFQPPSSKNIPPPLIEANRCFFTVSCYESTKNHHNRAFKQPHLVPRFEEGVELLPLCGLSDGEVHLFWVLKTYTITQIIPPRLDTRHHGELLYFPAYKTHFPLRKM
jgi:hypothetical protein